LTILFILNIHFFLQFYFSAIKKLSFNKAKWDDTDTMLQNIRSKYPDLIQKISKPARKPFSGSFWNQNSHLNIGNTYEFLFIKIFF